MNGVVVLRAASGASVGMGHAVRTGAVAHAVRESGAEALVVLDDEATAELLRGDGLDVRLANERSPWTQLAQGARAAWLDGCVDWSDDLRELRSLGVCTHLVENRTPARELADRIVYPALHHVDDHWDRAHRERVLGGAPWIPLAPNVRSLEPADERDVDLLVTFGGSDPLRSTERVLDVLAASGAVGARIVISAGWHMSSRRPGIEARATALGNAEVLPPDASLGPWMRRSRVAVTALATTLFELAYLRVPALVLANYDSDRAALDYYGEHGPHRPLGIAPRLSDGELGRLLTTKRAELGREPPPAIPGLGPGATALAQVLLGLAEARQTSVGS